MPLNDGITPFTEIKTMDEWKQYLEFFSQNEEKYILRGQRESCWRLKSHIERAFDQFDIKEEKRTTVEWSMIREFRRKYNGNDQTDVLDDTLYCMGLMRHHAAPTRLLDFTYSPYVE